MEQSTGGFSGGYATGPYAVGGGNAGEYSLYSPIQVGQNENRFGSLPSQPLVSGMGQYMTGPLNHQLDTPVAVTVGTADEFNLSPTASEYEKTKAFLKMRKSQLA